MMEPSALSLSGPAKSAQTILWDQLHREIPGNYIYRTTNGDSLAALSQYPDAEHQQGDTVMEKGSHLCFAL